MKTCTAAALACVAGLLGACHRDSRTSSSERETIDRQQYRTADSMAARPTGVRADEQPPVAARNPSTAAWYSADARLLSILHAVNQEEIRVGRLAQQRGGTQEVRDFGSQLVQDHTDSDAQVIHTADAAGISLMDPAEVNRMLAREKGDMNPRDPVAELRTLQGADFDHAFGRRMRRGHADMVALVEDAQPSLSNQSVRDLAARTLPTLHQHARVATHLAEDDAPR